MEKAGLEKQISHTVVYSSSPCHYLHKRASEQARSRRSKTRHGERVGWWKRKFRTLCHMYRMTSKARPCKGAGKGRRDKKGVLISANQTSHLFSLVCTAQTWMFPADVLWEDWILPMFLVYRLAALLGPRISSSSLTWTPMWHSDQWLERLCPLNGMLQRKIIYLYLFFLKI